MANMIQKSTAQLQEKQQPKTIKELICSMKSGIAAALPSVMTPERFTRIALSAVSNNPKLANCEPMSFLAAMMNAAQLGLEVNTPLQQAFLIPRTVKGRELCVFELGYQGVVDLAWRSGLVSDLQCEAVHENDKWEYELGLNRKLKHIPAEINAGDTVRYYAIVRTTSGGVLTAVMSKEAVIDFAQKKCDSYRNPKSAWHTDFDAMAKKTVLKQALKYAPKSTEYSKGVAADESIKEDFAEDMASVPNVIDAEVPVDQATGEVVEEKLPWDEEETK